jgi:hypothetical protein
MAFCLLTILLISSTYYQSHKIIYPDRLVREQAETLQKSQHSASETLRELLISSSDDEIKILIVEPCSEIRVQWRLEFLKERETYTLLFAEEEEDIIDLLTRNHIDILVLHIHTMNIINFLLSMESQQQLKFISHPYLIVIDEEIGAKADLRYRKLLALNIPRLSSLDFYEIHQLISHRLAFQECQ